MYRMFLIWKKVYFFSIYVDIKCDIVIYIVIFLKMDFLSLKFFNNDKILVIIDFKIYEIIII